MKLGGLALGGVVVLAGLVASPTRASAGTIIGINFTNGTMTLLSTAQPGIIPGANWNNAVGASGTNLSLQDSTGAATSALLTFAAAGAYDQFTTPNTPNSDTNTMYRGGVYGDSNSIEVSITVTGIPYSAYYLYVYASADSDSTSPLGIGNGTTLFYYASDGRSNSAATSLLLTTSTNNAIPTSGPGQYQLFSGLSGSSISLVTLGSISNVLSNNVFGLEIVEAPEPASFLMLVGGLGLLALRISKWRL